MAAAAMAALSPQGEAALSEGVRLCLDRWTALQLAVENGFGSLAKIQQLHNDVLAWFTATKGPLYIDELENLLDDKLVDLFSTEADDGSIEEVADQIMALHEDCLEGDFSEVERLSQAAAAAAQPAASRSQQVLADDDSSDEEDDEDEGGEDLASTSEAMDIEDGSKPRVSSIRTEVIPNKGGHLTAEEVEAGWQPVASRGRRKSAAS